MKVAVIGLGRFGFRLAQELKDRGFDLVAIDRDPRLVAAFEDEVGKGAHALALDASAIQRLEEADLGHLDLAVVCIGEDVEQSQLVTHLFKNRLGVPRVIARAHTDARQYILERLRADEVVRPESESAVRLAQRLAFHDCRDFLELAPDIAMVRIRAPERFWGETLLDLEVRRRYRVNIIGVHSAASPDSPAGPGKKLDEPKKFQLIPDPEYVFREGDELFVVGREEHLRKLISG